MKNKLKVEQIHLVEDSQSHESQQDARLKIHQRTVFCI